MTDDLRQRIADAMYGTYGQFDHHRTYAIADAVLAVVQPELKRLADFLASKVNELADEKRHYEIAAREVDRLTKLVAQYADTGIASGERAKKAEAALDRVRALHQPIQHMGQTWCAECSVRRSTGPKTYEWVAYIPHPCPTIDAIEEA